MPCCYTDGLNITASYGGFSPPVLLTATTTGANPVAVNDSVLDSGALSLTLAPDTATTGWKNRYSLDGSMPRSTSAEYTAPLTVSSRTVLRSRLQG